MRSWRLGSLVSLAALVAACSDGGGPGPDGIQTGGYDYDSPAALLYTAECAICHGEAGEGGLAPALVDSPRPRAELAAIIDERMPATDPSRCDATCAAELAGFIKEGLSSAALTCEGVRPSPRRLRLLTRREYEATVRDLFGGTPAAGGPACTQATQCGFRERCDGVCLASACDQHTFVFDPAGQAHQSVHVAGSFNAWAGSVAAGGLPLVHDAASGLWTGTFTLPEGEHTYKLVADGQWLADARAPTSLPDGYGGQNAVLALSCAGDGATPETTPWTTGFPAELRPSGFFFDDHANAAVVTAQHIDAYLDAAGRIADDAAARLDQLTDCAFLADPAGCAPEVIGALGRRIFRRPLDGAELARYVDLVLAADGFEAGLATALHAMLVSPAFLYRSETGRPAGAGTYRLTGYEVATALSYLFLGTTPDDALLDAAAAGELDDAAGIEAHARRLLADPRARAMVETFVLQWLGAEAVADMDKNVGLYPELTPALRAAMQAETRRFVQHVVFEGSGSFDELLTADYSFMNGDLAALYGASGPTGAALAQTPYPAGQRAGLLGHASVLAVHAHSDQTSPIRRGLLVRRRLLCQELPPPPANAGGVPAVDPAATTRERFAQHTADPFCASCHQYIDEVGFGLERFDAIGRFRELENGQVIDPSGDLNDVERLGSGSHAPYASMPELAETVARSEAGPACFVRQYYRFSRGASDTLAGRCARRVLTERFRDAGGDVRELMIGSVLLPDFLVRR